MIITSSLRRALAPALLVALLGVSSPGTAPSAAAAAMPPRIPAQDTAILVLPLASPKAAAYGVLPGTRLETKPPTWVLPVASYHLTGRFGQSSGLWASTHTGLDFAAPDGTPIRSIAPGLVTASSYDGSYGNKTVVRLDDGTVLWYCHQSRFGVAIGDRVAAGEVIGFIGSTGNVTGPHLHLEVHPGNGAPVDPETWLPQHGLHA